MNLVVVLLSYFRQCTVQTEPGDRFPQNDKYRILLCLKNIVILEFVDNLS